MFALALLTCIVLRAFSTQAKVSDAFECKEFFFRNREPGGMDQNAKKICQWTSKGIYYYATLYSVHHRIPLYSAYIFDPECSSDGGRSNVWHLEPQISVPDSGTFYMERENKRNQNDYKGNQAISSDYSDTGYDRGHLYPNSFQCGDGRTATFTLTNAAPMDPCFNRIQWGKREKDLRSFLRDTLNNDGYSATVYIVTGTVPNANLKIPQREISEDPERVTVPSHIWTAVCYKHNSDDSESFSFGYIGENLPEGSISVMGVSALNYRLSELYSDTSHSVRIFVEDCFDDNSKSSKVQIEFKNKINLSGNQRLQSSDVQNTFGAVKRLVSSDSISSAMNVKVSKLEAKLAFDNMDTYYIVAEKMKAFAESACLIKPQERTIVHDEFRKRDVPKVSDAVECLLVPEKQKTAADGSPCQSITDSSDSCQCYLGAGTKPCCSSPCLYQHKLNSYMCHSGQTLIECSPRYSLVTVHGERCLDDHPCATYGYDYYWCWTGSLPHHWDYCSPPLWKSKAANGQYCHSNHACAKYRARYRWCYTADGNNHECCISDNCFSTVTNKTCRSDHPCGYHGYDYLWCFTDDKKNYSKCCKNCSQ
ncbi:uncharacterized protein LOC107660826 [Sinocyclocheilus anshuiensis]|uniref:Uncharacterized LOC107660826 n=1 Tax=Sinocyclocheilus anshuiensis TaxID=1608454 RepID=A0A671P3G5_9TELE|nr:PREDICTED: uncharacterized protein LOC107660826 [Sinocyclocheilus anshuiensis]